MHEASIATPLLKLILEEAAKHEQPDQPLAVTRITIRAGLLMGIEAKTLQGFFELIAEGTAAEGAELVVETEPMQGFCPDCSQTVTTATRQFQCPVCQGSRVDWKGGKEFYIATMQVRPRNEFSHENDYS